MIRREGSRLVLSGAVTLASVSGLLDAGRREIEAGASEVDLGGVTELDSSLLAALLCWQRAAQAAGRSIALANVPKGLTTIAELYGVDALLGAAAAPA